MVKPEWGQKRSCLSCGARFYDLLRSPIICPKCNAEFDPEQFTKSRRSKPPAPKAPKPAPKPKAVVPDDDDVEPIEGNVDDESSDDDDSDDDDVLEDTSELGEDEDDVSEVRVRRDDDD